jgi:hypothetical protein
VPAQVEFSTQARPVSKTPWPLLISLNSDEVMQVAGRNAKRVLTRNLLLAFILIAAAVAFPFAYGRGSGSAFLPHVLLCLVAAVTLVSLLFTLANLRTAQILLFVFFLGGMALLLRAPGYWPAATATWMLAVLAGAFLGGHIRQKRNVRSKLERQATRSSAGQK